jgi:hypothetical protein
LTVTGKAVISADAQGVGSVIERDRILIDGERAPSAGVDVLKLINPATEEPGATVPAGTAADVAWGQTPRAPVSRVHS